MGCDEYHPISRTGENLTSSGGIGYMIVDAIDTIYLMGLRSEYEVARRWIETELSFNHSYPEVSTFEVHSNACLREKVLHESICRQLSGFWEGCSVHIILLWICYI